MVEMSEEHLQAFVTKVLDLPLYFSLLLKHKIGKLTRQRVKAYFKQKLCMKTRNERAFELLFNNYKLSHEVDDSNKIQTANFGKAYSRQAKGSEPRASQRQQTTWRTHFRRVYI